MIIDFIIKMVLFCYCKKMNKIFSDTINEQKEQNRKYSKDVREVYSVRGLASLQKFLQYSRAFDNTRSKFNLQFQTK